MPMLIRMSQVDQLLTLSEPYTFKNGVFKNVSVSGHKAAASNAMVGIPRNGRGSDPWCGDE